MPASLIKYTRYVANTFIVLGLLMFAINIIGLYDYTTIDGDEIENISDHPRTVSEEAFWADAYRREGESVKDYADRLTALIEGRMIAIDPKFSRPTFFENWILWAYANWVGYQEWISVDRAVRLGGGFCSQHALILDRMLDDQGIESRILGLSGHVLNEVRIDGQWKVYDSNYNVVFNNSLSELENYPERVYQSYLEAGVGENLSTNLENIFASKEDNSYRNSSSDFYPLYSYIEKAALILIWFIPSFLLITGLLARLWLSREDKQTKNA